MVRRATLGLLLPLLWIAAALAQTPPTKDVPRIQDNSFLIEEAYNQGEGVVQHIGVFTRRHNGDWAFTFIQEWPLFSAAHQVSYSIPLQGVDEQAGLGDVTLNYRYQLLGDADARLAVAPRFSLLLPTGDEKRGLGAGGVGLQLNVPVSIVLHEGWVAHVNAGVTYTPAAKSDDGRRASTVGWNVGQSLVWEATRRFNALLEVVYSSSETVVGSGRARRGDAFLLNPGIRWAYNFEGGLQIVPGIAVPIGLGPSRGDWAILGYLSFEHPFR